MSRATQLSLQISLADSAVLQQERDQAVAYAREEQDRANGLAEENAQLREALQDAQARNLELERQLIYAETMARTWQVQVQLLRRTDLPAPRLTPSKDVLTDLLVLAHPDKWHGQSAEVLAHEISIVLNDIRSSRLGVG